MIFDVEEELNWHTVAFVFKMYPGETYEDTHHKVMSSLNNFPNHVYTFNIVNKQRTGDWGSLIKLTVRLGLRDEMTIDEVFDKFDKVVHLQQREYCED